MTWRDLVAKLRSAALFGLGSSRPLPTPDHGVSRRAFLKVVGIGAATIALLPETFVSELDEPLDLDEPVGHGISFEEIDGILKAIYLPAIIEMLNQESPLFKFMAPDEPFGTREFVVPVKVGKNDYYTSCPASWKTEVVS